jgi:hypothetical protein
LEKRCRHPDRADASFGMSTSPQSSREDWEARKSVDRGSGSKDHGLRRGKIRESISIGTIACQCVLCHGGGDLAIETGTLGATAKHMRDVGVATNSRGTNGVRTIRGTGWMQQEQQTWCTICIGSVQSLYSNRVTRGSRPTDTTPGLSTQWRRWPSSSSDGGLRQEAERRVAMEVLGNSASSRHVGCAQPTHAMRSRA